MDDHKVRLFGCEDGFQGGEYAAGGLEQRLAREHQVEVVVRGNLKRVEDLVQQMAVLCSDADAGSDGGGGVFAQVKNDGAEFDGFGPGAEDE